MNGTPWDGPRPARPQKTRLLARTRPRTAKLIRDLSAARGRVALMVVAIAVALTGVGAMLVARAIVSREAAAAYTGTNPASATLDVAGGVDADLLSRVRQRPGIADATARQTVTTRVRVGDEWRRMVLFVIPPDDPLRLARFSVESGAWPAPADGILVERAATAVLEVAPGGVLHIAGADGRTAPLRVTGTTYDPALAPATQERTGYGYLTPVAAARLGYSVLADELKVLVTDDADGARGDQSTVDQTVREVAAWLAATGHPVHQVTVPPYQHPHQNQTDTITGLFLAFALAALILAGVLVATTLGGMLAAQTRQIGVMKTVGATTGQLLRLYTGAAAGIAVAATLLAVAPALLAGYGLAGAVADQLNVDITSRAVPAPVFLALFAAGLVVPVLVALIPLTRAARLTVRAALDDHGTGTRVGMRRFDRWLARVRIGGRATMLAARNALRRRTRLALTLLLLAAGGALFTGGLNTAAAWQNWVDDGLARRAYDVELRLATPVPANGLVDAVSRVDGVSAVEPIVWLAATPATPAGQAELQRTYPDGGHGSFQLVAVPADTAMTRFEVLDGSWLAASETRTVVLNQAAAARLSHPGVGSDIHLAVDGNVTRWRVGGIIAEVGGPAAVYAVAGALDPVLGRAGLATGLRVRVDGEASAAMARIESAMADAGYPVVSTVPTAELRSAIDEHVVIFIYTLVTLAILMAVVGVLGLAASMGIAVAERIREHGVMQAIGATPAIVRRLVLAEGVLTGVAGCVIAILLGIPTGALVGDFLGRLSFGLPLPLGISGSGLATWTVLAIGAAALAPLSAARRAARLSLRETLSYQ